MSKFFQKKEAKLNLAWYLLKMLLPPSVILGYFLVGVRASEFALVSKRPYNMKEVNKFDHCKFVQLIAMGYVIIQPLCFGYF